MLSLKLLLLLLLPLLFLSACGDSSWNGKDISGLMPELEFELTAETGERFTEQDFAGQPVAMYFGFTHCPDICPTTLARLVAAVRRLPELSRSGYSWLSSASIQNATGPSSSPTIPMPSAIA